MGIEHKYIDGQILHFYRISQYGAKKYLCFCLFNLYSSALLRRKGLLVSTNSQFVYSKTCVKRPLSKRPKIGFQDKLSLNAGKKYCRMLLGEGEHSAILSTFINASVTFVQLYNLFVYDFRYDFQAS